MTAKGTGSPPGKERGSVPIELAAGIGLLLLPVVLLSLSFGPWVERRTLARAAAAEAARVVVLADPVGSGEPDAAALVARMAENAGVDPAQVSVTFCEATCSPIERGEVVTVRVEVQVPVIQTPFGPVGGVTVVAEHSEPVDLYRSFP